MGSSGSGAADCAVGSIVWVRRRNGSWWPGKILGPEELSVSHLLSPRSGTPVKLLGREDASVDWYNLEKSKRVKAFRCGEFDDCIGRAESSQGTPIKKREKYARREDAILHALELEKQLLIKQGKLLGAASDKSSSVRSSGNLGNHKGKYGNPKSHQFSKKLDKAHQEEIIGSPLCLQDDNLEAIPRMRGLLDFGVRIAPSKRKLSSSPNSCERPSIDSTSQALPVHDLSMGRANHGTVSTFSGVEQMGAVSRAKRSKCVYLPTESSDSLDQKEIFANHNDVSPSQFGEGNFGPHLGSFLEENASGFMEDVDSDSSDTNSSKSGTNDDSSETEPETDKEMALLSEADPYALARPEVLGEYRTLSSEEPANSGDITLHYPPYHDPANEPVAKWKSKGKRNARSLPRRHTDASNRKVFDFGQRTLRHNLGFLGNDDFNDSIECDLNEMDMIEPGNGAYLLPSRYSQDLAWEDKQENFLGHPHVAMRARPVLVDVDLKVQASYQKEPVPIVSLMSKLNGKAIIGHPIQIEILEDGSTTTLLSTINSLGNKTLDDENTPIPQAWRTARRSANSRVPKNGQHRFLKKPPKSSPSLSGQKTRTLSSISVEQKRVGLIDREVKGEPTGITTVACIPIKLVFSRLLEKINRPHQPRL